jgi:hypothetical protein
MKSGDTFISPTGPQARFPEREMRVVSVHEVDGATWVDAAPIHWLAGDRYSHCTYKLNDDGSVEPVFGNA